MVNVSTPATWWAIRQVPAALYLALPKQYDRSIFVALEASRDTIQRTLAR
ncbi:hypothetical protein FrEUN1fDRAFT_1087 [Parafrankia sp. EUN1f]|nr:hypothetical protein FrEUN1fDRAFT_1087 [Parafrankia sp. EUN1f]